MIAELRCAVRWLLPAFHEAHGYHKTLEACGQACCKAGLVARTSWSEETLRSALLQMKDRSGSLRLPPEARGLLDEALGECRDSTVTWWGIALRKARERMAA